MSKIFFENNVCVEQTLPQILFYCKYIHCKLHEKKHSE